MDPHYEVDPAEVQGEPTQVREGEAQLAPVAADHGDYIPDNIDPVDDDVLEARSE